MEDVTAMLRRARVVGLASALLAAAVVPGFGASAARSDTIPTATVVVGAAASQPPELDFGEALVGYPTPGVLEVHVEGTSPVTFGDAVVEADPRADDHAADFSVGRNLCLGTTVEPGGTCTVELVTTASVDDAESAYLVLADDSADGPSKTHLTIGGVADGTGTYYATPPTRLLDTRTTGTRKPVPAGGTVVVPVLGRAGMPSSGVSAVVINLTAVATTASGYLTAYPGGGSRPATSTLNFPPSWTGATMATVPVGSNGAIAVYNSGGTTHVVVDVLGWYAADDAFHAGTGVMGAQYQPAERQSRVWDAAADKGRMTANQSVTLDLSFATPDDPDLDNEVTALALTVTAVEPTRSGYLAVWDGTGDLPGTSTLNFTAGDVVPNMVLVPVSHPASGGLRISLANRSSGTTEVLVDLVGAYTTDAVVGERFVAGTPVRIVDTRKGLGFAGPVLAGTTHSMTAPDALTGPDSWILVGTMTAINATKNGYLTVWDGSSTRPGVSTLNPRAGRTTAAPVFVPLDPSYAFSVFSSGGTLDLALDVAGTFEQYPPAAAYTPPSGGFIAGPRRPEPPRIAVPTVRAVRR